MAPKKTWAVLAVSFAVAASGCSGTKLVDPWRDPAYRGPMQKVFVLGLITDRGPRGLLEEEFVRQFKAAGADAVASTALLPDEGIPARETLTAKVREIKADCVLVTRFIKKGSAETHMPSRIYAAPGSFEAEWGLFPDPVAAAERDLPEVAYDYSVAVMRMTVYSVATGTAVWSSASETKYQGALLRRIKPFVRAIIGELSREGLLK
ncbi:MAG: hypothetical protein ACYC7L_17355 [Nitrospirota bacterium]